MWILQSWIQRGSLNHIWTLVGKYHFTYWLGHRKSLLQLTRVVFYLKTLGTPWRQEEYMDLCIPHWTYHEHTDIRYICWLTAYLKTFNECLNYFIHDLLMEAYVLPLFTEERNMSIFFFCSKFCHIFLFQVLLALQASHLPWHREQESSLDVLSTSCIWLTQYHSSQRRVEFPN